MNAPAHVCPSCQQPLPRVPGLYFCAASGEVIVPGGLSVKLTGSEAKLFALLHAQPGHLVTRTAMWQELYFTAKEQDERDPKVLDVLICHIRQKTKAMGVRIVTVWSRGYLLQPTLEPREGTV